MRTYITPWVSGVFKSKFWQHFTFTERGESPGRGHLQDYILWLPTHHTFFANASTCFNVERTAQGKILDTIHEFRQNVPGAYQLEWSKTKINKVAFCQFLCLTLLIAVNAWPIAAKDRWVYYPRQKMPKFWDKVAVYTVVLDEYENLPKADLPWFWGVRSQGRIAQISSHAEVLGPSSGFPWAPGRGMLHGVALSEAELPWFCGVKANLPYSVQRMVLERPVMQKSRIDIEAEFKGQISIA